MEQTSEVGARARIWMADDKSRTTRKMQNGLRAVQTRDHAVALKLVDGKLSLAS